jgi:hypothetical protein
MAILSENRKMKYIKSVTELLRLVKKNICPRRLLLHKQHFSICFKNLIRYIRKDKVSNLKYINCKSQTQNVTCSCNATN